MKHRITSLIWIVLAVIAGIPSYAADTNVVSGKLPNGLTYYIYHNESPSGRADFFLSRGVGSIVEREDERGLAHFLEHLAFNGTKHFPGNSLIGWIESIGVKFGENLNAFTSVDQTVYNICKVPTARESALDSCLLILRDWSCDITLADEDIDAERGVIKGEWRHRNSASNRLLQRAAPRIYGSSLYGQRLPMGLMSVVETFPPQRLRDFYNRNYTPDTEAIIVVGDIDVKKMEKKIRKMFGSIKKAKTPVVTDRSVETGMPFMAVAEADPEQTTEMVQLFFKHPAVEGLTQQQEARAELVSSLLTAMLVERFDRLELQPDAPATNIGVGDTRFLISEPMRTLLVRGAVRRGNAAKAVAAFYTEIKRARDFGFSATEFEEARKQIAEDLATTLEKDRDRSNTVIARSISKAFLHGDTLNTPQEEHDLRVSQFDNITLDEVVAYLRSIVNTDGTDALVLLYTNDADAAGEKGEQVLKDAFFAVNSLTLEPYNPEEAPVELKLNEPTPGKVVSVEENGPFGTSVVTLSNGLKAYLRPSKEKPGQIYFRGIGMGGLSQDYSEADAGSLKLLNEAVATSGVGEMTNSELRRFTQGKELKVSAMVSNTEETIEFSASPATLEDAFRLAYLKMTDVRRDDKAYAALIASKENSLANRRLNPIQTMGDSITCNVYSHHPLGGQPTAEMLASVDYDTMLRIYRDRFADFADFRFYVTGDFDTDSVKMMLERYVASLPVNGRMEKPRDIGYRFSPSKDVTFSRSMETPVAVVYQFRHTPTEYNLQNVIYASAVGQLLKARLLADLREKRGWTYAITTHGAITAGMNGDDPSEFMMPVYVKVDPDHYAEAAQIIDATLADMAAGNITPQELDKVKEYMLKSVADSRKDNAYWLVVLRQYDKTGLDMDSGYEDCVANLSPQTVSAFLGKVLAGAQTLRLTMTPNQE